MNPTLREFIVQSMVSLIGQFYLKKSQDEKVVSRLSKCCMKCTLDLKSGDQVFILTQPLFSSMTLWGNYVTSLNFGFLDYREMIVNAQSCCKQRQSRPCPDQKFPFLTSHPPFIYLYPSQPLHSFSVKFLFFFYVGC